MKHIFAAMLVLAGIYLSAQASFPTCISDEMRQQKDQQAAYRMREAMVENMVLQHTLSPPGARSTSSTYVIPVVVHIIHNNGPENISNAQVFAGIQFMNDAFANSGLYQDPNGVNTSILFCLAQQDENGNYTNGIDRVVSPLTNMTAETDDAALKNLTRWDPAKYLNIWIVNEITSQSSGPAVAGYAYLPASHGQPEDGIVNEARYFGTNADDSKVIIHEAGHYLGLYHTFEGGCLNNNCLTDGDRVCDTPPDQSTAGVSCTFTINTCSSDDDDLSSNNPFRPVNLGGFGDQPDQISNYMDYGYQACQHLFTNGQKNRMIAALTTTRASLLQSIGCQPLCSSPISIGFNMSASTITAGGTVNFANTTTGATNFTWRIGSQQFATTANASYQFNTPGYYTITLTATNNDATCDQSLSRVVLVECGAQASFTVSPPGPYLPGATLNFTNTSTAASSYSWGLDGIPQSNSIGFSYTFNNPGNHYVYLVATNGQCSDTSASSFFQVGNCGEAGTIENWFLPGMSMKFSGTSLPLIGASPVPLAIYGTECTSSYSDPDGNLKLFTDGLTVWNRNQLPMPNGTGLMGAASAAESCIIVPDPGSPSRYYIFTTDCYENNFANGLRYSIVDMTLDGGMGDVISSAKNIPVMTGNGEQVTATYHSNRQDVWITVVSSDGSTVYAYLLTASGLSATPVVSVTGTGTGIGLGAMRFSHDGNRLAYTLPVLFTSQPNRLRVTNFNTGTGQCSGSFTISYSTAYDERPYGIEFSPDNSKLYVSVINTFGKIYQYDLAAGGPSAIIASQVQIDPFPANQFSSYAHMTLGPDGRIWVARGQLHIDYIPDPDHAGTACGYVADALIIPGVFGSIGWCMPNFMQGITPGSTPRISGPRSICSFSQGTLELAYYAPGDHTVWTHAGPGTISNSTDSTVVLHTAASGSTDTIMMSYYGYCGAIYDTFLVQTISAHPVDLGPDTVLCSFAFLVLGPHYSQVLWQDMYGNSTMNISYYSVSYPGLFTVAVVDSNGCATSDSIVFSQAQYQPAVSLGNDTTVCTGTTVSLHTNAGYLSYTWQDGSHNSSYTAWLPGMYWVTTSDGCVISSDTVRVAWQEPSIGLDLGPDTVVCPAGFPFTLSAPPGHSYLWQDGSAAPNYTVNGPGTFWVNVLTANGCEARDTIAVAVCTGLQEQGITGSFLYPNPASGQLMIQAGSASGTKLHLTIFDPLGRVVREQQLPSQDGPVLVDISDIAEGIYLVRIEAGENSARMPLLIRRH